MTLKSKLMITALLVSFLTVGMMQAAQAYSFYIDQFSITKNGVLVFNDLFDDGNPPPSAPNSVNDGSTESYSVVGTMGPENSGKLKLDSSGAVLYENNHGILNLQQVALRNSNTDPSNTINGLKINHTFAITGVFDLIQPNVPNESYAVLFTDGTSNPALADDIVMMAVFMKEDFSLKIGLLHIDNVAHTNVMIYETPLDTGHGQIALTLTKEVANSNVVTGSFRYIDGGIPGDITTFADHTTTIFTNENFTRAAFGASTPAPVPEPTTMLLFGLGLLGLAGIRKMMR